MRGRVRPVAESAGETPKTLFVACSSTAISTLPPVRRKTQVQMIDLAPRSRSSSEDRNGSHGPGGELSDDAHLSSSRTRHPDRPGDSEGKNEEDGERVASKKGHHVVRMKVPRAFRR